MASSMLQLGFLLLFALALFTVYSTIETNKDRFSNWHQAQMGDYIKPLLLFLQYNYIASKLAINWPSYFHSFTGAIEVKKCGCYYWGVDECKPALMEPVLEPVLERIAVHLQLKSYSVNAIVIVSKSVMPMLPDPVQRERGRILPRLPLA
jgi:hypothetical protein